MGSQWSRRDRYLELWHREGADAARLAFLLDPDPAAARATAERSFSRCISRMQDHRTSEIIDIWFRRDVVRLSARRNRLRLLRDALKGRRSDLGEIPGQAPAAQKLWRAFLQLPLPQRAAIVLDVSERMPRSWVADVIGRSEAGTSALIERGWAGLEARLGHRPDEAEFARLLADIDATFEPGGAEPSEIRRRGKRARRVAAAVAVCLAGGAVTAALAASSALTQSGESASASQLDGSDELAPSDSSFGLAFRGSPGWCPDPRRTLPINEVVGREATRTAIRVAISIVKGYTNELAHLIEVPAGAEPAQRWPGPGAAGGLIVVARGPGGLNDSLAIECGVQVADRTWIAIIEDRLPPQDDAVAMYVLRRPTGFKVWGSLGDLSR